MSMGLTIAVTVLIIAASAFFVIIEFSLLAARRHRLEESAATSRSARAAVKNLNELTVMLAGAQLGITVCTFALGATAKPAVHDALMPLFELWGLPLWASDAIAFALALFAMTFLHLVVGEMAPKSWAIAHPEFAAKVIAIPTRVFVWIFRPLLLWINVIANHLVAKTGVEPVDQAADASYDPQTLRHLVRHSTQVGVLDQEAGEQIDGLMQLNDLKVDDLMARRTRRATAVNINATVQEVQEEAQRTGHLRILLDGEAGEPILVVHVRDTLLLGSEETVTDVARPVLTIGSGSTVMEAFNRMRDYGEQLIAVMDGYELLGVVTWDDVLQHLWPDINSVVKAQTTETAEAN